MQLHSRPVGTDYCTVGRSVGLTAWCSRLTVKKGTKCSSSFVGKTAMKRLTAGLMVMAIILALAVPNAFSPSPALGYATAFIFLAFGVAFLVSPAPLAAGKWQRTTPDGTSVTFQRYHLTDPSVTIELVKNAARIIVKADTGTARDGGVLFGRVRAVERCGFTENIIADPGFSPSEGDLFSVRVATDKNGLKITNLRGLASATWLVEGDYRRT